jgi:transcriptional regulator with XRE-family HTH domain
MITGNMIRGARALLGWSAKTLAGRAHVGTATILRIERGKSLQNSHYLTIDKIRQALLEGGVRFVEENNVGPSLQLLAEDCPKKAL